MKRIEHIEEDIFLDVVQTCQEFENILPDSVSYQIFNYYSLESSEPIIFVSIANEHESPDVELAKFLNNCDDVPDHIQTETRAGGGEPVILCERVGDCKCGFDFLLENYPPWQKYKMENRETERIGQPLQKYNPAAKGGAL